MNNIYKQFKEISKGMENLSKVILYKKMIENLQEEKEESEDAMINFSIGILEDAIKYRTKCKLEGKTEEGWIPVSERLPEKNMSCLVSVGKFNFTQIAIYSDLMETINHKIFWQGEYGKSSFKNITQYVKAWMLLPERYKEETNEKNN